MSDSVILALNCGSSSIKFAVFDASTQPLPRAPLWGGKVQGIGGAAPTFDETGRAQNRRVDLRIVLKYQSINETLEKEERVSVTDMLVKITAMALRQKLFMNVSLRGDRIVTFREVHLGVAVALEGALIVPVIRNADEKSLTRISRERKRRPACGNSISARAGWPPPRPPSSISTSATPV